MGKKVDVPGKGMYGEATAWMRKKQIYTKAELIEFLISKGLTESAAGHTAVVLLSPREESKRGDCRGNMSNPWGHIAYNEKLPRREKDGVKEDLRFRFRLRKEVMEPRKRILKAMVEGEKVKSEETAPDPLAA